MPCSQPGPMDLQKCCQGILDRTWWGPSAIGGLPLLLWPFCTSGCWSMLHEWMACSQTGCLRWAFRSIPAHLSVELAVYETGFFGWTHVNRPIYPDTIHWTCIFTDQLEWFKRGYIVRLQIPCISMFLIDCMDAVSDRLIVWTLPWCSFSELLLLWFSRKVHTI